MNKFLLLMFISIIVPICSFAQAPSLVNFQGKLTDASGVPVPDTSYSIRFRVYSIAAGGAGDPCTGSCHWEETQSVFTQSGIYSVLLGSVTPLTASVFDGSERYVGVKVGAEAGNDKVVSEVIASIRKTIGPVAAFKSAVVVDRLPKTRSGNILRGTIAHIADDTPWTMPATVDDPVIFEEITQALSTLGYPK